MTTRAKGRASPKGQGAFSGAARGGAGALPAPYGGRLQRPGCSMSSTNTGSARKSIDDQHEGSITPMPRSTFFDALVTRRYRAARRDRRASLPQHLATGWSLSRLDRTMLQILRAGDVRADGAARCSRLAAAIGEYLDVAHAFFDAARGEVRQRRARCRCESGALASGAERRAQRWIAPLAYGDSSGALTRMASAWTRPPGMSPRAALTRRCRCEARHAGKRTRFQSRL